MRAAGGSAGEEAGEHIPFQEALSDSLKFLRRKGFLYLPNKTQLLNALLDAFSGEDMLVKYRDLLPDVEFQKTILNIFIELLKIPQTVIFDEHVQDMLPLMRCLLKSTEDYPKKNLLHMRVMQALFQRYGIIQPDGFIDKNSLRRCLDLIEPVAQNGEHGLNTVHHIMMLDFLFSRLTVFQNLKYQRYMKVTVQEMIRIIDIGSGRFIREMLSRAKNMTREHPLIILLKKMFDKEQVNQIARELFPSQDFSNRHWWLCYPAGAVIVEPSGKGVGLSASKETETTSSVPHLVRALSFRVENPLLAPEVQAAIRKVQQRVDEFETETVNAVGHAVQTLWDAESRSTKAKVKRRPNQEIFNRVVVNLIGALNRSGEEKPVMAAEVTGVENPLQIPAFRNLFAEVEEAEEKKEDVVIADEAAASGAGVGLEEVSVEVADQAPRNHQGVMAALIAFAKFFRSKVREDGGVRVQDWVSGIVDKEGAIIIMPMAGTAAVATPEGVILPPPPNIPRVARVGAVAETPVDVSASPQVQVEGDIDQTVVACPLQSPAMLRILADGSTTRTDASVTSGGCPVVSTDSGVRAAVRNARVAVVVEQGKAEQHPPSSIAAPATPDDAFVSPEGRRADEYVRSVVKRAASVPSLPKPPKIPRVATGGVDPSSKQRRERSSRIFSPLKRMKRVTGSSGTTPAKGKGQTDDDRVRSSRRVGTPGRRLRRASTEIKWRTAGRTGGDLTVFGTPGMQEVMRRLVRDGETPSSADSGHSGVRTVVQQARKKVEKQRRANETNGRRGGRRAMTFTAGGEGRAGKKGFSPVGRLFHAASAADVTSGEGGSSAGQNGGDSEREETRSPSPTNGVGTGER